MDKAGIAVGQSISQSEPEKFHEIHTRRKIGLYTARDYTGMCRAENHLTSARKTKGIPRKLSMDRTPARKEDYENMIKEELILELAEARIAEVRLKKDPK